MYRVPAIVVLLAAAAFSTILEAQMRTMRRPTTPARITTGPHLGVVQPRPGGFRPISPRPLGRGTPWINPAFQRHLRFHVFFGNSCFSGPFFDPFFCRAPFFTNRFLFNRFLFTQPVFWPYPVYSAPYYPIVEQTPTVVDREDELARQVERLTNEVARLREEEESRERAQQASKQPPPPVEENTPTVLIFRDGHTSEVRNYAVVGQTLWALTEQQAQKIPVSELDVEATKKVNADRSVEIRLP